MHDATFVYFSKTPRTEGCCNFSGLIPACRQCIFWKPPDINKLPEALQQWSRRQYFASPLGHCCAPANSFVFLPSSLVWPRLYFQQPQPLPRFLEKRQKKRVTASKCTSCSHGRKAGMYAGTHEQGYPSVQNATAYAPFDQLHRCISPLNDSFFHYH